MSTEASATQIGFGRTLNMPFEEALERTEKALAAEGFGVLCHIDVQKTLQAKLGVDFQPYRILGACLPARAHKALSIVAEVGLMLPCNVVVRDAGQGKTRVEAVDPDAMSRMFPDADLSEVTVPVKQALTRVIESV
jgi:uncharacterized protein (DUF302 family)